jgi:hypothetical protein
LLSGPFDDDPEALYNSLGTYNQAVLLNTTAALSAAGVNLGNANFIGFYRSKKPGNVAFGIEVTGVGKGDLGTIGPSRVWGYRSPGAVKIGSVEATFEGGGVVAFDVDLFNPNYDVWGNVTHKYGWGGEVQGGTPASSTDINYSYTGNRRNGFSCDAAGNLTSDIGQNFTYDVTGQQTASTYTNLQSSYDGDGLRVKRTEDGLPQTYYLRSSVLGGQVVAEIVWTVSIWQWNRGYVYLGSQLLAVQQAGVNWMHEDPVTKSKRVTNSSGAIISTIELDPWGADTNRSSNAA